jgi:hypothetical protein
MGNSCKASANQASSGAKTSREKKGSTAARELNKTPTDNSIKSESKIVDIEQHYEDSDDDGDDENRIRKISKTFLVDEPPPTICFVFNTETNAVKKNTVKKKKANSGKKTGRIIFTKDAHKTDIQNFIDNIKHEKFGKVDESYAPDSHVFKKMNAAFSIASIMKLRNIGNFAQKAVSTASNLANSALKNVATSAVKNVESATGITEMTSLSKPASGYGSAQNDATAINKGYQTAVKVVSCI